MGAILGAELEENCGHVEARRAVANAQMRGERVRTQLSGRGARLFRQALRSGVTGELVRVWPAADRKQERRLKLRAPKRHCPKCQIPAQHISGR